MSKIPFFKFFSNSKFSVSNVNKYYVGVKPQPTLNCVGRIWKRSIKDSPCHPELAAPLVADEKEAYKGGCSQSISGSGHRQKCSAICTQKSNVGLKAQPTKTIYSASRKATRHVKGDLVPAFTLAEVFLPYYNSPRKVAFTLAEVLITLGIIGVVAAMTLPALINKTQGKELEVGLKRAYTIMQSALNQMNYEQGFLANGDNYSSGTFMPVFSKYLKTVKDCGNRECEGDSAVDNGTGELEYNRSANYRTYNNNPMAMTSLDDGQFVIVDGMFFMIENDTTHYDGILYITVDVNGQYKKPNRWGHDLFTFQIVKSGKLLPMGAKGTSCENGENCSRTSTSRFNGMGCTYRALTEKNYFKNLPK